MQPLNGVRIAVTRAAAQSRELADPLRAAGAGVLVCPLIRIQPGEIGALPLADWIILTSANAVDLFMKAAAGLERARYACVGPGTAQRLAEHGITAELVPGEHTGEAVARALIAHDSVAGKSILIPRGAGGGEALPDILRQHGARVYDVELYRSVPDEKGANLLRDAISSGAVDLVTFTSGSTVRYFVQAVGITPDIRVAVIGPSTAAVAQERGLRVDIEADPHTTAGLVQAIVKFYGGMNGD